MAAVALSEERDEVWVQLYLGDALVIERPMPPDGVAAIRAHRWVVCTVGQDPWDGRDATRDRYLTRAHRLHLGRLPLTDRDR